MTSVHNLIEVELAQSDDFLRVKETLTRIGIASYRDKKLFQSCHILHKRGKYYIVHFKELFALDGKTTDFTVDDIARRNHICNLLQEWRLLKIVSGTRPVVQSVSRITKVIRHSEKENWNLIPKYSIGKDQLRPTRKTTHIRRTFNRSVSIGHSPTFRTIQERKVA